MQLAIAAATMKAIQNGNRWAKTSKVENIHLNNFAAAIRLAR